jgi:hypothetical protein
MATGLDAAGQIGRTVHRKHAAALVRFLRCDYLLLERSGVSPARRETEPRPRSGRAAIALEGLTFQVRWNPAEADAAAFASKVYHILRRLTVDRFTGVERVSRRAFSGEAENMRAQLLAGHHAVAWALKRRHNYFSCNNWAALLKPANYPFRARDILTKRRSGGGPPI